MGQHKLVRFRICSHCGAQETTDAAGIALHLCQPDPRGKQAAWRARMRRQGRCMKCGRRCLPYTECSDHRFTRRLRYALSRGVRYGLFVRPEKGYYAMGDEHAKVGVRGWYKTNWGGRAPRGFYGYAQAILHERGPMTGTAIAAGFTEYRRERAAQGHLEATAPGQYETRLTSGEHPE